VTVEARELGRGIGVIRLPLPFPALKWTNAYLVRSGGDLTLIDCGVDSAEGWKALTGGLNELGHHVTELTTVVGTHMHPDHIGMASRVVASSGARLVMHASAPDAVAEYNDWSIAERRVRELAQEHGVPDELVPVITAIEPRPVWAGEMIEPTDVVEDGDRLDVGEGRTLGVLHTPGHEGTHICLVDSLTEALFSGDHILPRITPVVMHHPAEDRLGTYLASLARIERMDVGLTYAAHVGVLERGSLRARQIALHHERRLGAMLHELRREPRTAWHIVGAIFRPHLGPLEQRLALLETIAHLEYLVRRNEAERTRHDDTWHYRQPARGW
jgi:glyoxylase-like metal-dependent hydrolase (beta-lactamase superfamily II)